MPQALSEVEGVNHVYPHSCAPDYGNDYRRSPPVTLLSLLEGNPPTQSYGVASGDNHFHSRALDHRST